MAQTAARPSLSLRMRSGIGLGDPPSAIADADASDLNTTADDDDSGRDAAPTTPTLVHRFRADSSILCLAAVGSSIVAGTQRGKILIYTLATYEKSRALDAHRGAVLGLCLSSDGNYLFSTGSDRIICAWDTRTFSRKATLYTRYDVGDIFCASYNSNAGMLYLGCQNTSLLWCDLRDYSARAAQTPEGQHPSFREDRFFNSAGPGGVKHPQQDGLRPLAGLDKALEISSQNVVQFAHYGYVYCMLLVPGSAANVNSADQILVTGGGDGAICLWKMHSDDGGRVELVKRLGDDLEGSESVISLVLDGTLLFSGRTGGEIHVWDLEARQQIRILKNTDADILSLSTTGSHLLYCLTADGEALHYNQRYDLVGQWKAHAGRSLASIVMKSGTKTLLVSGGSDDSAAVWDIDVSSSPAALKAAQTEGSFLLRVRSTFALT